MAMTIFNNFNGRQSIKVPGKNPIILAKPKDSYTFESLKEYQPYRKQVLSKIATGHITWKGGIEGDTEIPKFGLEQGQEAKSVEIPGRTEADLPKPTKEAGPADQSEESTQPTTETETGDAEQSAEPNESKEQSGTEGSPQEGAKKAKAKKESTSSASKKKTSKKVAKKKTSKKATAEKKAEANPASGSEDVNSLNEKLTTLVAELKKTPREEMDRRTEIKEQMKAVKQQIVQLQP